MTNISRRHFLPIGLALPLAVLAPAMAQEAVRPEVKLSKAKPIIREYVEKMAADSKMNTGADLTEEQKNQLVDSIVRNMEAQHIYAFVDP